MQFCYEKLNQNKYFIKIVFHEINKLSYFKNDKKKLIKSKMTIKL
jgi:hypothetical protein